MTQSPSESVVPVGFWRAELHNDGSIKNIVACAARAEDGSHIVYVEAASKEAACTQVLHWAQQHCCKICRKAISTIFHTAWHGEAWGNCKACEPEYQRRAAEQREQRAARRRARVDQEIAEADARQAEKARVKEEEQTKLVERVRAKNAGHFNCTGAKTFERLLALFDSMPPDEFRAWIVGNLQLRGVTALPAPPPPGTVKIKPKQAIDWLEDTFAKAQAAE